MTDTQQPTNPARPAALGGQPLPQRQNGPQTVRIPVTSLVNPQQRKALSKGVPPEEPPEEPWQEDELDPADPGEDQAPPSKAPTTPEERSESIQIPRRPTFSRAAPAERSESRPEIPPRSAQTPAPGGAGGAGQQRPSLSGLARANANPPTNNRPNSTAASNASNSGRPVLPRMELKPVLPVNPEKSGVNVAPVPPRVLAPPPPASSTALEEVDGQAPGGAISETPAPARFGLQNLARSPIRSKPASDVETETPPASPPARASRPAPAAASKASASPDLSTLLEHLVNLPDQTAILGVCDDRLPVLLDLSDPTPGALLVASDDASLRDRLVRTLLQTAAALNSPRSVQFLILSSRPAEWQAWLDGLDAVRHCLGIDSLTEGSPGRWLLKLAGWADQRRTGTSNGPAVILVVDDLASVPQLEYDARVNFDWLVKEGPGVRIWPVVGMPVERAPDLARWVRLFKTRILGPAQDASLYRQLAALDEQESSSLLQDAQFAVRIQEDWLKFRVPALPGEKN